MASTESINDHGLEVLKKAARVPDTSSPTQYAIRTSLTSGMSINSAAKFLEVTYTDSTTETYKYYESSAKVTLYNTITVVYTDSSKSNISTVEYS